ncbi:HAD-IA family hydrolase [Algibacillus agarilyticus]|uniref:HAD-IA family hydrolase n=1 Tax=Algibacillus agarilyticus TaxID=2234133 RepID=UPI000DD0E82F|nr:HAD-IA family hydrolase [Algibacillus agarilyticus]
MLKYKVIIFDWDGTLMDSIGKIVHCMQETATKMQFTVPSYDKAKSIIGLSLEKAIATLFPEESDDNRSAFSLAYSDVFKNTTFSAPLFDDALPLLNDLIEKQALLAVATGKRRAGLTRIFENTQTEHYFKASRCADECASKPDPQMLLEIVQELGVNMEECVFIGDTVHDLAMAEACNMDHIGITHGAGHAEDLIKHNPVAMVDSLTELNHFLNIK